MTLVGYTGGELFEPTYKRIGDHTEAILVEFDETLTYEAVLEKFWKEHTPGIAMRQYRSAVFYHDEAQKLAAETMRAQLIDDGKKWCRHTAIEPAMDFYQAEEYHQKYLGKMLSMNFMLYGEEERKPIPP